MRRTLVVFGAVAISAAIAGALGVALLGVGRVRGIAREMGMRKWVDTDWDVAYGPYPENRLDVMRPRVRNGSSPVAVVFHGGGWLYGGRYDMRERVCRRYLAEGFVVMNVEYRRRLSAATEDASRALEWAFRHAPEHGGDAGRIVVTGESAGGHLALMAAFRGPKPRVVINIYGVADPGAAVEQTFMREALAIEPNPREALALSPMALVRPGLCPVLSAHGTADGVVPYEQSVRLTEKLRAAGIAAELFTVERGGHGFDPEEADRVYGAVFDFLRRNRVL